MDSAFRSFTWPLSFSKLKLSLPHQSPAQRLGRHLRIHERRLSDFCVEASSGKSLAEAISEGERSHRGHTGLWRKNKELCDPMDKAFASVALPWIFRKAVGFLNLLELEYTEEHFKTILKAGGIMDVVECYPTSGEVVLHPRRDKRPGHHTGRLVLTKEGPQLEVAWEEPYSGSGTDTFILSEDGSTLTQVSNMRFSDSSKDCQYRTVYYRVHSR